MYILHTKVMKDKVVTKILYPCHYNERLEVTMHLVKKYVFLQVFLIRTCIFLVKNYVAEFSYDF